MRVCMRGGRTSVRARVVYLIVLLASLAWSGATMRAQAPDLTDHWFHAMALYSQGKWAEAEAAFRDLMDGPVAAAARAYVACCLFHRNNYSAAQVEGLQAMHELEASCVTCPPYEVALKAAGESLVRLKMYSVTVDELTRSLRLHERLAYAYFWRAQGYQGLQKIDRAVE